MRHSWVLSEGSEVCQKCGLWKDGQHFINERGVWFYKKRPPCTPPPPSTRPTGAS